MRNYIYLLFVLLFFFLGCSSEKNTFTNRLYHNVTAHFNAYYLAKEKIAEAEANFAADYQEDFTQVLPVYPPIDSSSVESNEGSLEEARELASKAVEWHRISNWVDDSYYLIGLIDYYEANTDDAINTFKFINVNSKENDVRHKSLIQLLRIFVDYRKFDDASYVIDFLSKESEISKENKQRLYLTLAYYYETRNEKDGLIAALEKALEFTPTKKEQARVYFILAQLYQREGFDAQAYSYYNKAQEGNPPYELTFFSQLYAQQVAELEKSKDLKKVRAYYDELYEDRKNIELRDVVLYEKALFELKQGEIDPAINLLHRAAQEEGKIEKQKGYIYAKLAEIYFDDKEDYRASKYYLDSAIQKFKPTDKNYAEMAEKKEVLDRYTANYELIVTNDSLIRLSRLSPEEQEKIADAYIKQEEDRLLAEAAKKTQKKNNSIFDNLLAFGGSESGASFYFDNPTAIQQGKIDFAKNWGSRALNDNWRRKSSGFETNAVSSIPDPVDSLDSVPQDAPVSIESSLPEKESLLANIPSTPEEINQLRDELETAYFELGKILYFDLHRPDLAKEYLSQLIQEYPESEKMPEVYYTLYLIEKSTGGNTNLYVSRLNREFPQSPFTKSVNNPQGESSSTVANKMAAENYKMAYEAYQNGEFAATRNLITSTLENYPLTPVTDKLLLLDIMVSGKTESKQSYQAKLEEFIKTNENIALVNVARNMLVALTGEETEVQQTETDSLAAADSLKNEIDSAQVSSKDSTSVEEQIYKDNKNQTHIFILVIDPDQIPKSKNLSAELENFHNEYFADARLRTGNLSFTRHQSIILVSPFANSEKAMAYRNKFLSDFDYQDLSQDAKNSSFVISIQNFQQLNKRKDIAEYEAFFKSFY